LDAGDFKGGAELMQEAAAIGRRLDDPHLNADIACGRAEDAVEVGDLATARREAAIAQHNVRRLTIVPTGLAAECARASGQIALREGDYPKAITVVRDAMRTL